MRKKEPEKGVGRRRRERMKGRDGREGGARLRQTAIMVAGPCNSAKHILLRPRRACPI